MFILHSRSRTVKSNANCQLTEKFSCRIFYALKIKLSVKIRGDHFDCSSITLAGHGIDSYISFFSYDSNKRNIGLILIQVWHSKI